MVRCRTYEAQNDTDARWKAYVEACGLGDECTVLGVRAAGLGGTQSVLFHPGQSRSLGPRQTLERTRDRLHTRAAARSFSRRASRRSSAAGRSVRIVRPRPAIASSPASSDAIRISSARVASTHVRVSSNAGRY